MRIVWMSWKDIEHPLAGGAEVVGKELASRLVQDGHEVIFLTAGFKGSRSEIVINGYKVIRLGSRLTVYWKAYRYFRKYLRVWPDLVIDEMNTVPFFAKFYTNKPKLLFVHQLARKIWFYQLPLPFSLIGYALEPLYIRLLSDQKVITISNSTKSDLLRHGFKPDNIQIISEGIDISPIKDLRKVKKYTAPTLLSFGAIRPMKRTLDQIKAFEIAKTKLPNLKLKVAGDSSDKFGQKVLSYIKTSPFSEDIEVLGRVDQTTKTNLMQKCHAILATSVKEGWGLIVTEANSQGTPAIVYDVDGLRDSVRNGWSGLITKRNSPEALGDRIKYLMQNADAYNELRSQAWGWSKQINFDIGYQQFSKLVTGH